MRDLGLLDSRFGIILGFAANAFNVILLRNFFEAVPKSFEEAAKMDGASELQLLWKVFIPLSKPAIVTVALFCIVSRWNGYFWAMVLLRGEEKSRFRSISSASSSTSTRTTNSPRACSPPIIRSRR